VESPRAYAGHAHLTMALHSTAARAQSANVRPRRCVATTAASSVTEQVRDAIDSAQRSGNGREAAGFAARAAALESLDVHVFDRLRFFEGLSGLSPELRLLQRRGAGLRRRLEETNERFVRALRRRIREGRAAPAWLRRVLAECSPSSPSRLGYDSVDLLVMRLLGGRAPSAAVAAPHPEMVPYQPTPVRAVLAMIDAASLGAGDVLYDLGSGLGHVVILAALLSAANARGVEVEPSYDAYARQCVRRLNVPRASFVRGDAREADFDDGTLFFMYTPFRGELLRQVLERLRDVATKRPLRLCTYGPCTHEVALARWLRLRGRRRPSDDEVALFDGPVALARGA